MSPAAFAVTRGLERRAADWSGAVEFSIQVFGGRLGGTSENVVPASDLIVKRFD
jgi:hypothetical protein